MIDRVSPLGYFQFQAPTANAVTGASAGVFNLITTQAQGRLALVQSASASTVAGASLVTYLQTSSDNSTFANVFYPSGSQVIFTSVTNVANTAGTQAIFVDSALLSNYNRVNATVTGSSTNFSFSVIGVYVQKNA